jgi:predicted secreted protein
VSAVDRRGRVIAVVAHCLLNQNTVVKPLASHEGVVASLVDFLARQGYGLVQLPCPETLYLGMRRWWMSREQYDTESYREFSRRLLEPYVKLLAELTRDGCTYVVLGVRGSPSCAVETTTSNPSWSGEPRADKHPPSVKISGRGVFMEELLKMLEEHGLPRPLAALDVDHREASEQGLPEKLVKTLSRRA